MKYRPFLSLLILSALLSLVGSLAIMSHVRLYSVAWWAAAFVALQSLLAAWQGFKALGK